MQGRGEINSPRPICCWARRVLAQPSLLGRVWPRREFCVGRYRPSTLLGRDRPSTFLGRDRPSTRLGRDRPSTFLGRDRPSTVLGRDRPIMVLGLSPAQWFGPAQPDLIFIIYIYIIFCIIYIYIYEKKNYKNLQKL